MTSSKPKLNADMHQQVFPTDQATSSQNMVSTVPADHRVDSSFANEEDRIRKAYARRTDVIVDDRYSLFLPGNVARLQEIERRVLRSLKRYGKHNLDAQTILEVGCGHGYWLRKFIEWGADPARLHGIDLLESRIQEARRLTAPGTHLYSGSAGHLGFPSSSFEIVCQFMMFSSILDRELWRQIAAEMLRVLKPGGMILWYDCCVDNPRNPDIQGLRRADLRHLFPDCRIDRIKITFLPPVARRLGWTSALLYPVASALRLLNSHYLAVITANHPTLPRES